VSESHRPQADTLALTNSDTVYPQTPQSKRATIIASDILVAILVFAGAVAINVSYRFEVVGIRISVGTPWRPWLWAVLLAAFRLWLDRRPPRFERLWESALRALPQGEARLFEAEGGRSGRDRLLEFGAVFIGFTVLVAAFTWPQVRHMRWVPDLGDPLFSIWRIAWVNHQLPRHPLTLFDGNIFYPERLTLTYSDPVIVPALMSAPLFWLGIHKVAVYNLLFLSAFVFSGVAMYLLVRALTGRRDAAVIAGVIFALYPYRFEHYSHLELQMTMWMPLGLWGLHRAMASGRLRDALVTGVAFALQLLSSLYYGMFFAVYLAIIGLALWIGRGYPRRPVLVLASGAAVAALLVAPVVIAFTANRSMMGDREVSTVQFYSAEGPDYLKPHIRSFTYGTWSHGGHPERQLFPRITPVVLSAVALWPPLSVARIGYAAALALTVDGSLGLNGKTFPLLRKYIPGYSGLRVPARFSALAGMTLAILAGYGAARLFARWPYAHAPLTAAMLALVAIEALPSMPLEPVWREPPAFYERLAAAPPGVLAEFPMPIEAGSLPDSRYMYFSTFHWQKLVNGDSGFYPPSYYALVEHERDFPSDAAVRYLRERGVDYIAFHGAFTNPTRYQHTSEMLDRRADLELVAVVPWEGSESRLYRFRP
jgi:hypothetical protein